MGYMLFESTIFRDTRGNGGNLVVGFRSSINYFSTSNNLSLFQRHLRCNDFQIPWPGRDGYFVSKYFLNDSLMQLLTIFGVGYQKNHPCLFSDNSFPRPVIGCCLETLQYEFKRLVESAEPASASAQCVPLSHGLAP